MKILTRYNWILEAATWLSVIIFTAIVIFYLPTDIAGEVIRNIAIVSGGAAVFWYLKSRRLYLESEKRARALEIKQKENVAAQKTLSLIFNNSADGILVLDPEQRIVNFSPGLEKISGFKQKDVLGQPIKEALAFSGDAENSLLPDVMFLPSRIQNKPHIKNKLLTKDGREIDIEASCALIHDLTKSGAKAFAIIRDMTYENELARRDKEFIALSSHQLNTPLSIIQGYLDLLRRGKAGEVSAKQRDFIDEILRAVKKMISLTNNMLSISRIEQEKIKLNKSDVNVADLMESLEESFGGAARKKGINLIFPKITRNLIVYADKDKLIQALSNLIDNAIKYTKRGSVSIDIRREGGNINFSVRDSGIGIGKEEIEKIGQKFYRAQEAIDIDNRGTGLGLFIAKTIIEKHGGKLEITSRPQKGSEFEFNIPGEL